MAWTSPAYSVPHLEAREDSDFESADDLKLKPACCTPILAEEKSEKSSSACCVESLPITTGETTSSEGSTCDCQK